MTFSGSPEKHQSILQNVYTCLKHNVQIDSEVDVLFRKNGEIDFKTPLVNVKDSGLLRKNI